MAIDTTRMTVDRQYAIQRANFHRALDTGNRVIAQRLVIEYDWASDHVEDELAQWLFQE